MRDERESHGEIISVALCDTLIERHIARVIVCLDQ